MIVNWIVSLGPWNWIILGGILLSLEILVPGVYLLWIGIAAILTGTLTFQLAETGFWMWQVQVVVFLALSLVTAVAGKRFFGGGRADETDQPLLNRRDAQLVGRVVALEEAIVAGRGRARIGDSLWTVAGPDLPAGTRVRVTGSSGSALSVEPE